MEAIIPPSGGETPAAQLGPNTADIAAHLYALFSPMFVHDYPDAQIEIAYADMTTGDQKLEQGQAIFCVRPAEGRRLRVGEEQRGT